MIWISSTENELWSQNNKTIKNPTEKGSELIIGKRVGQPLYGWGCCISEICAKAVLELSEDKQKTIFDELFGAENCGFDYCRLSIGANDFAESWYSYDETDGDYALEHFSVARDEKYIFPAIREAKKRSPELRFFASPWSTPTWMKFPKVCNYGRLVETDENLKAYVFDRDHYKCVVCKRKLGSKQPDGHSLKGMMHHITFRSKGATDNPDQLVTVCEYCHTPQAHKKGGVLWNLKEKHRPVQRGLRDATQMNIIRTRLVKAFPDAELTYGNITVADRKKMHLPKSHAGDAVAIAMKGKTVNICEPTVYIKQVRKKKRSLHEATPRKGRKNPNTQAVRNPKNTKSIGIYHIYDTVRFQNKTGFISGFTGMSAYVQDFDGNYITMPGKSYKQINLSNLELVRHNNNWIQKTGN